MYRVKTGYIRNVKISDTESKTFYAGEALPFDYVPDPSYLTSNIVELIDDKKGGKK